MKNENLEGSSCSHFVNSDYSEGSYRMYFTSVESFDEDENELLNHKYDSNNLELVGYDEYNDVLVDEKFQHLDEEAVPEEHVCVFCNEKFHQKSNLEFHLSRVIECSYCTVLSCVGNNFLDHLKSHESGDDGRLSTYCEVDEAEEVTLKPKSASKCIHQNNTCNCSSCSKEQLSRQNDFHLSGKEFRCSICGKKWMQKYSTYTPLSMTHNCEDCRKKYENSSKVEVHVKPKFEELAFCCDICGKLFKKKSILSQHIQTHDMIRNKHCDICGKDFTSIYFPVHLRIHTGAKPFKCDKCNRSFSQASGLWEHRFVHELMKKYRCHCGFVCNRKRDLNKHSIQHTGKGYIYCKYCNKSFTSTWILQNHERLHTKERPFMCSQCGQSFSQKANLFTHFRKHTGEKPFECKFCGRSFALKTRLERHVMIHTNEKPFKCDICDKSFRQLSTLRKHKIVHTKPEIFKCGCCGEQFRRKSHYTQHITKNHVLECYL